MIYWIDLSLKILRHFTSILPIMFAVLFLIMPCGLGPKYGNQLPVKASYTFLTFGCVSMLYIISFVVTCFGNHKLFLIQLENCPIDSSFPNKSRLFCTWMLLVLQPPLIFILPSSSRYFQNKGLAPQCYKTHSLKNS